MKRQNHTELKPCPFCGRKPKIMRRDVAPGIGLWSVYCASSVCPVAARTNASKIEVAVSNWNTRAAHAG
jgi:hypothetical protein